MKRFLPFLFLVFSVPVLAADPLYLELSARGSKTDLGLSEIGRDPAVANAASLGGEIRRTLKADLAFTGLFTLIEGGPLFELKPGVAEAWSRLGADVVASGRVEKSFLGGDQFTAVLSDAYTGQRFLSKTYPLAEGARGAAHRWADEIVRYFTGQPGIAASRIVFVNDATGKKEVCAVDPDGKNFSRLTDDRSIALFPKFSPDGKRILYTTYRSGRPEIHVMGADGAGDRPVCRYEGLNAAAAWAPDGRHVVATLSRGGDPNLYLVDLEGRVVRRLTESAAADTAPTVSPDGLQIAFTSDRPGPPQIYLMDRNGADVRRMTRGGLCDSPHWSPLGHQIVFTMSEKRYFDLWILEVATGRTERVTFGEGDNENASWSPDGRHLVFTSTRGGRAELWVMNADGSNVRRLAELPGASFTPHWGPGPS